MTREEANKALLKAIEEGDVHKMELAISQGADVNATTTTEPHHPFILLAARSVNPQLCQILIDNGANVNARNDDGTTALMEARSAAVAKTLIRYRAYVNAKNNRGQTALMLVINQNSEESALDHFNVLLNCMASPFAKDNEGNDVFYYIDHNKKEGWIDEEEANRLKNALIAAQNELKIVFRPQLKTPLPPQPIIIQSKKRVR